MFMIWTSSRLRYLLIFLSKRERRYIYNKNFIYDGVQKCILSFEYKKYVNISRYSK